MTVSSTQSKSGPYAGAGTTGPFTVGFRFLDATHLRVVRTDANGVDATLLLDTDYSVSGVGADTGSVLLTAVLAAGNKLTIIRNVPATQDADYVQGDAFPAESHETALDKLTMLVQQSGEELSRAIKVGISDAPLTPLPPPGARANAVVGFDALGNNTLFPITASVGAGDMRVDTFTAGVDFTAGVTTQLILSRAPGNPANLEIFFDPLFQGPDQWSLSGSTVTFTGPIPVGTAKVFARHGTTLSTQIPPAGSVTDVSIAGGTKLYNRINDLVDVKDFGAVGNGTADDRAAFVACDAAGRAYFIPEGTYRIASNLTLSGKVTFSPGAVLKPDAGVTVTFAQNFAAANSYQIFDLSNAGAFINLPYNITEVWAEWWGASGQPPKVNNEVPINQAISALAATAIGGSGVSYGTVRLGRGTFYTSGPINLSNLVTLSGYHSFYTLLRANVPTWSGTNMVNATLGSAIFASRVEHMRLDASAIGSILYVIYSNAWQEKCGLYDVYMANFQTYGFFYESGNGGAAHLYLEKVEAFPNNVNGAQGIHIEVPYSQGWLALRLSEITVGTASSVPVGITGISLKGRILASCSGIFGEQINQLFLLDGAASVGGSAISGGLFQAYVFNCVSTWTGNVDATAARLGNAGAMVVDSNRPYAIAANDPDDGHLVWPPSPTRAIAAASVTAGGSLLYNKGFSASSNLSTGEYSCTLANSMDNATSYDVIGTVLGTGFQITVSQNTATQFNVSIRSAAGAAVNAPFALKVYHKG